MRVILNKPEPSICIDNVNLEGMIVAFRDRKEVHILVGIGNTEGIDYAFHPFLWNGVPLFQTRNEYSSVREALEDGKAVYVFDTDKKFLEWVNQ